LLPDTADVGRLFGRLYVGGAAEGGGGGAPTDLGEPVRDAVLEAFPDPGAEGGGGGLLARSVPALTCSLNDFCCACRSAPSEPPVPDRSNVSPGDGNPGGIVGGVLPNCPVPDNTEVAYEVHGQNLVLCAQCQSCHQCCQMPVQSLDPVPLCS